VIGSACLCQNDKYKRRGRVGFEQREKINLLWTTIAEYFYILVRKALDFA